MEKRKNIKGKNNPFYGKIHNDESKLKMKKAWEKRKTIGVSETTRLKLSQNSSKYWLGKKRSKDTIQKMLLVRRKNPFNTFWKSEDTYKERNKKVGLALSGINNYNYRGQYKNNTDYSTICDWKKIRILVLRRDNNTCQCCGITKKRYKKEFDIHHKIPFIFSRDNSINNLITLCKKCHFNEERKITSLIKSKLLGGIKNS